MASHIDVALSVNLCMYVCMYVFMYVCMYVFMSITLISMGSLVARTYRHDLHMVVLTLCTLCVSEPWWNLSCRCATVLEHESGRERWLCHKREGQRKGIVIEWERSGASRKSLVVTGKLYANQGRNAQCTLGPLPGTATVGLVSVRLLLHGWQYIWHHLSTQNLADLFIDFNMHLLCQLLVFLSPHNARVHKNSG